jgi:enediyne biosynthesis protein E4
VKKVGLYSVVITVCLGLVMVGCNTSKSQNSLQPDNSTTPAKNNRPTAQFQQRLIPELEQCAFSNGKEAGLTTILEIVGGGVSCLDYDLDGWTDFCFARGGKIDKEQQTIVGLDVSLLSNRSDWRFRDVSRQTGIKNTQVYSHGSAIADYDHDGFSDLLVYGFGGAVLCHNQGDGTFLCTSSDDFSPAYTGWTSVACWLDLTGDGLLDLYLGSYVDWSLQKNQVCPAGGQPDVCSPNVFGGTQLSTYINQGDGTFLQSQEILPTNKPAKSLGVLGGDFSGAGRNALYIANDLLANHYFVASGVQPETGGQQESTRDETPGKRYEEIGIEAGVAVDDQGDANGSMGVTALDFNLDQQFDIFVTNFEHEKMALYLQITADLFRHASRQAGLSRPELKLVGFGVVAADFDSDADEDVIFTSGHVQYFPSSGKFDQLPAYIQNEAGKTTSILAPDCDFFRSPKSGRGLASCDMDRDGDIDFLATSLFGIPTMVENTTPTNSQWLTVSLVGTTSSRTPYGAVVHLQAGSRRLVRQLFSGGSYQSQGEARLHFAWPQSSDSSADVSLRVVWPEGAGVEEFHLRSNQHYQVIQGISCDPT